MCGAKLHCFKKQGANGAAMKFAQARVRQHLLK
jgi:hypothetical protein